VDYSVYGSGVMRVEKGECPPGGGRLHTQLALTYATWPAPQALHLLFKQLQVTS